MNECKDFVHLLGEPLHGTVDLFLELFLLDLGDLVLLLEEHDVSPDLLYFDLELLHELLVGRVVLVDVDHLFLFNLFLEATLFVLQVLHHFVTDYVFLADLDDLLLEDL